MWHVLESLLDIVLPRKERVIRIESYTLADLSIEPLEHESCGVRITTLLSYRTQVVDDLIRALKYNRARHAAHLLAEALAEYLREEIASLKSFSHKPIVLIPVPMHKSRARERGFNHVETILNALPPEFQDGTLSRIDTTSLCRVRGTKQQTRLTRAARLKNVAGAFTLTHPEALQGAHVILIDDVTTTGATLSEAARPLATRNVQTTLLAIARA